MSRGDLIAATVSTSQPLFEPPKLETTEPIFFEDLGCLRTVSRSSNTELDLASFRAESREIISLIAQLVSLRARRHTYCLDCKYDRLQPALFRGRTPSALY
jgi:hypothetical protein